MWAAHTYIAHIREYPPPPGDLERKTESSKDTLQLVQSVVSPKPIVTRSDTFPRAFRQLHVMSSSFDWLTVLSVSFVIGYSDNFGIGFTGETKGAFHSTKIIGSNFRNFRWSNGTRPTASQNSRSRALQHRACWVKLCCLKMADFLNIFAALEQGDCQTISCTILDRIDDVILLAAVACFMRKELTLVNGYFEVTIPAYLSGEFENHFRMTGKRVSY